MAAAGLGSDADRTQGPLWIRTRAVELGRGTKIRSEKAMMVR